MISVLESSVCILHTYLFHTALTLSKKELVYSLATFSVPLKFNEIVENSQNTNFLKGFQPDLGSKTGNIVNDILQN